MKIYERGTEARATVNLNVDNEVIASLLLDTSKYEEWLLGGKCHDVTRLDDVTDIVCI